MRELFLGLASTFIALFGGLTLYVVVRDGVTIIGIFAFAILTMIGIGVYGAIRNPPNG